MHRLISIAVVSMTVLFAPARSGWARMTPSEGPPWFTTYAEARREALREGKPVFVYFTKYS